MLKYKEFTDEEFEIIGVDEGSGQLAGCCGSFFCKMESGLTFKAKLEGKFERLKYIYTHQNEVLGKMVTVKYQNLTTRGIPRFPVAKSIRGFKDKSDWI